MASIGMPASRARAVQELAARVASGALRLAPERDLEQTVERLCALPGVGSWTAQYISMRALREPDAFPEGDVALRRALAADGGSRPSSAEVQARAEAWRPWRAYAALYLWTNASASSSSPSAPVKRSKPASTRFA